MLFNLLLLKAEPTRSSKFWTHSLLNERKERQQYKRKRTNVFDKNHRIGVPLRKKLDVTGRIVNCAALRKFGCYSFWKVYPSVALSSSYKFL